VQPRELPLHAIEIGTRIHIRHVEGHTLDTRTLAAEPCLRAYCPVPRGKFGKTIGGKQHWRTGPARVVTGDDSIRRLHMSIEQRLQRARIEQWMVGQAHQRGRSAGKAFAHRADTGTE